MKNIKITGYSTISCFIKEKPEDFELIPNQGIRVEKTVFRFENKWNECRNFLGLMATVDPALRMPYRMN